MSNMEREKLKPAKNDFKKGPAKTFLNSALFKAILKDTTHFLCDD